MAHYVHEKRTNPDSRIVWKSYEKSLVDKVDHIVELAHGHRENVINLKDWEVVGELLKFFAEEWPQEFEDFKRSIPKIRESRRADGYSESREIKYVAALPPRFERMIKSIFPGQEFDKKFIYKLIKKFPVFKVGGINNMSKGGVIL